jgi:hypothetical protein
MVEVTSSASDEVSWSRCQSGHRRFVVGVSGGTDPPQPQEESTMAQYMLSVHSVEGEARESMTEEEMQQSW